MGPRQSFWDSRPDSSQVIQHTFITKVRDKYCELHKDYSFQLAFCFSLSGPILHSFSASVLITIAAGRVCFSSQWSRARHVRQQSAGLHPILWQGAAQERRKIVHWRDALPHNNAKTPGCQAWYDTNSFWYKMYTHGKNDYIQPKLMGNSVGHIRHHITNSKALSINE